MYYKIAQKRLLELLNAEAKLDALESAGVDNWEWYGEALEDFEEYNEKELKELFDVIKTGGKK